MFNRLFTALRDQGSNDDAISRRLYTRRSCDKCVSVIGDQTFPVENWSMGGLLVAADGRLFGVDNEINVTMKFKLRNEIIEVLHKARVIRKTQNNVAFEFSPLTSQIRKSFQSVVDDYVSAEFAESQLA